MRLDYLHPGGKVRCDAKAVNVVLSHADKVKS